MMKTAALFCLLFAFSSLSLADDSTKPTTSADACAQYGVGTATYNQCVYAVCPMFGVGTVAYNKCFSDAGVRPPTYPNNGYYPAQGSLYYVPGQVPPVNTSYAIIGGKVYYYVNGQFVESPTGYVNFGVNW